MAIKSKRVAAFLGSSSLTPPLLLLGTASALLGSNAALAFDGNSLPQGGTVTGGSATIATSGQTLTVNQSSNRAVIDWRSFNIGANAQANFNQPNSSSIAVNRVNGSTDPSHIDGGLHANGQVWILNPNGVLFGKTAHVDAAGIVATTANIDDKAFMAGSNKLQFTGGDSGEVANEGHITVGEGGLAAFVAPSVRNSGTIRARVGKVALAAGDTYTLDLAGDDLVELGLGAGNAVVDQSGKIINAGGTITITAKAAGQVVDSVINVSGVTSASSVKTAGGQIILGGDDINVASSAKLSADGTSGGQITAIANKTGNYAGSYSARGTTGDGGQVETSGKTVQLASDIKVNTSAPNGKTGNWTLDPDNLTVQTGGDSSISGGTNTDTQSTIDPTAVVAALNSTNVTLQANNSITVNSAINASANTSVHNLTLADENGGGLTINLNAPITLKSGGVLSGQATTVNVGANGLIQNGVAAATNSGATVNILNGTYTLAGELDITKSLTLNGQSEAGTIINSSSTGYGIFVDADNTTLSNFTYNGSATGTYSLKIEAQTASTPLHNFTINNVAINNSKKTGLDLNGVNGATISGVTVTGTTAGNGIGLTDSANVTITGTSTSNNAWGGLALYQANIYSNQQETGISVDGTNTFHEANGIYAQDQSATNNFGTITLPGNIQYIAQLTTPTTSGDGTYTLFQQTQQGAIDQAAALNARYSVTGATVQGFANGGVAGNNIFTVGYATGGTQALAINAAISGASANAIIDVLPGTYSGTVVLNKSGLTLQSTQPQGAIIDAGNSAYGIQVSSTPGNLGTLTVNGFKVQNWTSVGILQGMAAGPDASFHVLNNAVYGPQGGATANGNGIEVSGDGSVVSGNQVHFVHLNSTQWSGSGILVVNGSNITVENNSVDSADIGIGVTNWNNTVGMTNIVIDHNAVSHSGDEGISVEAFEGVYGGVASGPISGLTITNNTVTNTATNSASDGLGFWDYSDYNGGTKQGNWSTIGTISGNSFSSNGNYQIFSNFTGANVAPLVANNTFDRSVVNAAGGSVVYGDLQPAINDEAAGSTLKLAGTFGAGTIINQNGDTLDGQNKTLIQAVNNGDNGLTITANNVTVKNLEIAGPANQSYLAYAWGSNITRGIVVSNGAQNFAITGNNIHGTRNDILVDGRNTGSITGNIIDNSKSGISVQYTDGTGINISGNAQGQYGNEWGENLHLNGNYSGGTIHSNPYPGGAAPSSVQTALLADSAANGGWTIQDQAYTSANRTAVTVATTGSNSNQGSPLSSLATIQAGIAAVVSGGTVNVDNGTYVIAPGGYINVNKSLNLVGQSEAGVIIDARNASTYGLRVTATDGPVSLSNFTLYGVTASGGYGLKAEATQGLALNDITSEGAYKSEFDLNGVVGGTLNGLTANGDTVGTSTPTGGNGISLTDSQNITITNSVTENNAWGGLALYQGTTYNNLQLTGITVAGTNTFHEANGIYAQDQSSVTDIGTINLAGQGIQYVAQLTTPTASGDGTYTLFQQTQQGAIDQAAALNARYSVTGATVQGFVNGGVTGNNIFTVSHATNGDALSVNAALNQSSTGSIIDVLSGTYAEDVAIQAPRTVSFGNVTLSSLTSSTGAAGSVLSGNVAAGSVALNGAIVLGGNLTLDTSAANGAVTLAAVDGSTAGGQALTIMANTASLGNLGATTRLGTVDVAANTALSGTNDAASFTFGGNVTLTAASTVIDTTAAAGDITFTGAIFGTSDGRQSLTLSAGPGTGASSANGDITMANAGTTTVRLGTLNVSGDNFTALTVDLAGDFNSKLTGNQVFAADTLNTGGNVNTQAGGNVSGHIASAGTVALTTPGTVSGNIGGSSLTLNSGSVSNATLSGNSVNANVTNGFNATVNATNSASIAANTISGAISGANLAVTGGSVNGATLTGNSVSANVTNGFNGTVNASNSASIAANTISGSVSGANLTITGGSVSNATLTGATVNANVAGGFDATVNASNNASIAANTISGNFSGSTVSLSGQSVSGQVTATTLNVASQGGSVTGDFTPGNVTGFVDLNGQTTSGGPRVPGQQLVVENFALPAGTQIAANGALILPQGVVIGLLSPGGGPAKVIMVNDVRTLGQLLAEGYVAIVIDLKKSKDVPIAVASN